MTWKTKDPRPYRDCVVCGAEFAREERGWSAITCTDECGRTRHLQTCKEYQAAHPEQNRKAAAEYKARNVDFLRQRRRERRARLQSGHVEPCPAAD